MKSSKCMTQSSSDELLPHLFRLEYAKMTAVLCRHFGLQHIEVAEDIASEAFLKASEHWALHGVPPNPSAWLYTVAKNKAKDYLKRTAVFETRVKPAVKPAEDHPEPVFEFTDEVIADSQLAMIFAVCNPANSVEAQICLALQVLCGFGVEEIAGAFLTKTETIKKRLLRARANLRNDHFQIKAPGRTEIESRLDTVLKTLYLLFNEGYFSRTGDRFIRKDLCAEAIRLTLVLTQNTGTNTPPVNALLALMCFQSSRLDARTDGNNESIPFERQDKSLWNKVLIEKGNYYLVNACTGNEATKYHLEAAIAYWHTTPTDEHKWVHILHLYNQLLLLEYSPVTALNRVFAYAQVHGAEKALPEAEKLQLAGSSHYHQLLGYLYVGIDTNKAIDHYTTAMGLTRSVTERKTLIREIERLTQARG